MKKIFTILFIITLTLSLVACTKKQDNTHQIHIGLMKGLVSVPFYYAQDQKIFEKYGIDVKLELFNSAKDRDASFQGNKINAVSTDMIAALLYLNSGKDIVITSKTEEQFRLVSNSEYNVNSITDINGGKIGLSENTVIEYLVYKAMQENNVTNYTKVPVPSVPDRFSQLKTGKIDMAIMPEPFPSLIVAQNGKELWNNIDNNIFATVFVVDKEFAELNYKEIMNLNKALNEAITKMMEGSYEDYQDIIVNNGLLQKDDLNVVKEQEFHTLTKPSEETFNDVVNWCKNKGLINEEYKLDDLLFPYSLDTLSK